MNHYNRLIAIGLALVMGAPVWADPPEVLQKTPGVPGAHWNNLDFADITNTPSTVEGYGITNAVIGDRPQAISFIFNADAAGVVPEDTTLLYPSYGDLAGMVCDVVTAPIGGDIVLDLLTGTPLATVYGSTSNPVIAAGDTTTLTGTPQALPAPVALAPRTPVQLRVISAPSINVLGTMALIADLPDIAEAGTRYLVEEDGHVWQRNLWDAVAWTDTGLPGWPGDGSWLGAVANDAGLSALTPASGDVWITADTAHRWAWSSPSWIDQGLMTNFVDGHAFIPVASSADLPTSATAGVWYMTLNTGHLYRNDAPPWLDMGLATAFPGAGLRCSLYIYPKVAP